MRFAKAKDIGNVRSVTINSIPSFNVTAICKLIHGRKEKCGVMEKMKIESAVSGVICAVRIVVAYIMDHQTQHLIIKGV